MDGRVFSCADFVGINEDTNVADIIIYPNPVNDQLNIELNDKALGDFYLKIYSVDGKLLMVREYQSLQEEKISIDFSTFIPGIYFLYLHGTHNSSCFKVKKY
jgi:hypothetical protein